VKNKSEKYKKKFDFKFDENGSIILEIENIENYFKDKKGVSVSMYAPIENLIDAIDQCVITIEDNVDVDKNNIENVEEKMEQMPEIQTRPRLVPRQPMGTTRRRMPRPNGANNRGGSRRRRSNHPIGGVFGSILQGK
jgi:hypothetical protein